MTIIIGWKYSENLKKWVMYVYRNRDCVALLIRPDEQSCREWAEKNIEKFK